VTEPSRRLRYSVGSADMRYRKTDNPGSDELPGLFCLFLEKSANLIQTGIFAALKALI
jgi:hypothetical protein